MSDRKEDTDTRNSKEAPSGEDSTGQEPAEQKVDAGQVPAEQKVDAGGEPDQDSGVVSGEIPVVVDEADSSGAEPAAAGDDASVVVAAAPEEPEKPEEVEEPEKPEEVEEPEKSEEAKKPEEPEEAEKPEEPEVDPVQAELDKVKNQLEQTKDRMLRIAADFDNFRKRSRRDVQDAAVQARSEVLLEFLPVLDNLERALDHASKQGTLESMLEGVGLVIRQFGTVLSKFNIESFSAVGEAFDPARHEAVNQKESDEHPAGAVLEQWQKGYIMGERLIRPAMVVVSIGPAAAEEAEEKGEQAEGAEEKGAEAEGEETTTGAEAEAGAETPAPEDKPESGSGSGSGSESESGSEENAETEQTEGESGPEKRPQGENKET